MLKNTTGRGALEYGIDYTRTCGFWQPILDRTGQPFVTITGPGFRAALRAFTPTGLFLSRSRASVA